MTVSDFQTEYLSQQPFLWLALAALLGLVIGVFIGRWLERSRRTDAIPEAAVAQEVAESTPEPVEIAAGDFAIGDLPNMDKKQLKQLRQHNIQSVAQLRQATSSKKAREDLADAMQLEDFVVNKWARMSDFLQLEGMTPDIAEFLVFAGITSTKDLASRNAESVAHKLQSLNEKESRVQSTPTRQQLQTWVDALAE